MFGLIRSQKWSWYLSGKHPIAGDFLTIGRASPLLRGFAGWMEKGYAALPLARKQDINLRWMFWARGPNGELICGLLKTSHDLHGRSYPLMIVGAGPVAECSDHWDVIPYACQGTWAALVHLGEARNRGVRSLKNDLLNLRFSTPHWKSLYRLREAEKETVIRMGWNQRSSEFMDKMNNIEGLSRCDHFLVPLDVCDGGGGLTAVSKMFRLLKSRAGAEPAMVFMGGGQEVKSLLCLKRPLQLDDFSMLWSAGREVAR